MHLKIYSVTACTYGLLAVILGAFGAHKLKSILTPEQLQSYQTGVQYQFYHAFALLVCVLLFLYAPSNWLHCASGCFAIGILLFSGSIYLLTTKDITGITTNLLGPITPIGGLLFILGWVLLLVYFVTVK